MCMREWGEGPMPRHNCWCFLSPTCPQGVYRDLSVGTNFSRRSSVERSSESRVSSTDGFRSQDSGE